MAQSERITRLPNGTYHWTCPIDRSYYRRVFRFTALSCGSLAAFILLYFGFLSFLFDDWQSMGIVGAIAGVFILITVAVCALLDHLVPDPQESYEMTEDYIKIASGRSWMNYEFRRVQVLVIKREYLELRGKMPKLRIYTHEEDRELIEAFIKRRVPEDCEIRRE